eukprot:413546_1
MKEFTGRLALPSLNLSENSYVVALGVASGCTLLGLWVWQRPRRYGAKTAAGHKSMNANKKKSEEGKKSSNHSIYCGRVWHNRYLPTHHGFNYPIFFFAVDLDEPKTSFPWYMWPLISSKYPAIARFDQKNHLKDHPLLAGEEDPGLGERVKNLVKEQSGWRPSRIVLLTHLSYFGYFFSPVSFYYCRDDENNLECIVAEISNTPWLEMHSYVLSHTSAGVRSEVCEDEGRLSFHFQKSFHVSPFMDMNHAYTFSFSDLKENTTCDITMHKDDDLYFDAKLLLKRYPFSLASIYRVLFTMPAYTLAIQLFIHWEAFLVFIKGIPYNRHPEETDTVASKIIGKIMTPAFWIQDKIKSRKNCRAQ